MFYPHEVKKTDDTIHFYKRVVKIKLFSSNQAKPFFLQEQQGKHELRLL